MTDEGIDSLLARMRTDLTALEAGRDARRFFHATYLRTTQAVADELARGGFADSTWVEHWDLVFADLYLDALEADLRGDPVTAPWRVAFDAAHNQPDLQPLRHVLFGLNAHINFDLPQALVAVISSAEFADPEALSRREADHLHLDTVLQARVRAEDAELGAVSTVTIFDRLIRPANRVASRRLLAEARSKVWRNAKTLDAARLAGEERYAAALAELERRCAARVRELTAPGPVLLTLARRGFGVLLS
jgi:Family of unknown function (DUF5995)